MGAVQASRHADRQALTRELVDHHQQSQAAAIMRLGIHEIVAPHMVPMLRAQPDTTAIVQPQSPARLLTSGNLQPFPPPDALHSILAHLPPSQLQQGGDPAISKAAVLAREREDRLRQPILVFRLRGLVTLCRPPLPHQPAGMPFTHSFVPSVLNGDTSPHGT